MAFVVSSAFAQGKGEVPDSLFDKAVEFIKRAEGWHRGQMPYIGYGHRYANLDIILTLHCK